MIVTHKLSMQLNSVDQEQSIQVVQNDSNSRVLELALYENEAPWVLPEGIGVKLRYRKPDGTAGEYDSLADGSPAWSCEGNVVTLRLLGVLSTMAGVVHCTLVLEKEDQLLHSFCVQVLVQPDLTGVVAADGGGDAGGAATGTACMLRGVPAQVGQVLRIAAVDETGNILAVEAFALPQAGMAFDGGYVDDEGMLYLTMGGQTLPEDAFTPFAVGSPGLPMPPTAAVGQNILVAAVDEYGRVTATKAETIEVLADAEEGTF